MEGFKLCFSLNAIVEDTMVDQDHFGIVPARSNGNCVRLPRVTQPKLIGVTQPRLTGVTQLNVSRDEIALAYSARAYHRKAHKPRPAQSEDGKERGDGCPESQDEQFIKT